MVEHRLSHRIKRQEILYAETWTPYTGIIHEAALRMQFGAPEMMRKQSAHIAEMSEREGRTVLVSPSRPASSRCGADGCHRPRTAPSTGHRPAGHGARLGIPARGGTVGEDRTIMGRMEDLSLDATASRDFIHALTTDL